MSSKSQFQAIEGVWAPRSSGVGLRDGMPPRRTNTIARWSEEPIQDASGQIMVGCVSLGDLSCVYQPIVDLQNGKPFAYEVLARCRAPGLTNPSILFKRAAAERFCGLLGRTLRRSDTRR